MGGAIVVDIEEVEEEIEVTKEDREKINIYEEMQRIINNRFKSDDEKNESYLNYNILEDKHSTISKPIPIPYNK
jgi:hypothetical protein